MGKRELIFDTFDNKATERIPVGFWFHFAPEELYDERPEVIRKNINGHQKFFDAFAPDFLKLMSDGYFTYPNETVSRITSAADLNQVKASDPTEWIDKQVALVQELTGRFKSEVATFYNIFAPATFFKFLVPQDGGRALGKLLAENPEGVRHALNEIGKDIALLAEKVIREGGADGIYLSAQNIQDSVVGKKAYLENVAPSELKVLEAANRVSDYNILHICGYEGARNDLSYYVDYPAKAVNWAVTTEKVSLREGKKLFGGRAVIGGFNNTTEGVLYKGTREEIEAYTAELIRGAGKTGVVLGADCTVPSDIDLSHLEWVREKAKAVTA